MRDSFIFYRSYFEAISDLTADEQLTIYNAIFDFSLNAVEPELSGVCNTIFKLLRPTLSKSNTQFENGSKGGRPKKETNPTITQNKPNNNPKQSDTITQPHIYIDMVIDTNKILSMFDTLWEIYPKKVGKEQAKKTFEHKLRGMTEQEAKDKANTIYTRLKQFIFFWREKETEIQFVPNMSTWLNAEIEDSKHFKGGKKL